MHKLSDKDALRINTARQILQMVLSDENLVPDLRNTILDAIRCLEEIDIPKKQTPKDVLPAEHFEELDKASI
jgi:hypothetical protein